MIVDDETKVPLGVREDRRKRTEGHTWTKKQKKKERSTGKRGEGDKWDKCTK